MSIEVTQLTKVYGSQKALDAVSFSIGKGEIVGFLAPNGAGKSTAMKLLAGCLTPTSGTALVNGYNVVSQRKAAQRTIGYLPEHNPLYADMYVREFLAFHAAIYGIPKSDIPEMIDRTGLAPEVHKKIAFLSKGYRQRVGLAAALLHRPETLILDEPATGLDPNQLIAMRTLIRQLGGEKTVLLSTHIMQEVEAVCDRVMILHKGKLVADRKLSDINPGAMQLLEVEFDYRIEDALLNQLPYLTSARNKAGFVYEFTFDHVADMRPAVFDFANENGLKILQLNRLNRKLEKLFYDLTKE